MLIINIIYLFFFKIDKIFKLYSKAILHFKELLDIAKA